MNFPWPRSSGNSDADEKRRLERELAEEIRTRQLAERQISELSKAQYALESRLRQVSYEHRSIVKQNADKIAVLEMEHSKNMNEAKNRYDRETEFLQQEHKSFIENLTTHHDNKTNELENEITKLVGQLLVNQDDNQAWPDDKLKINYREMQRLIESVTSPRHKEFLVPPNQQLGSHLDPTNFLSRAGRGKFHLMLKSDLWSILCEQFFCTPFGFGALGPNEACGELIEVYSAWRKLFDPPPRPASTTGEDFSTFYQDKLANKWRSINFQCIGEALTPSDGSNPATESRLARLNSDNIHQTANRIMNILSQISRLSGTSIKPEIEDQVRQIVQLARNVALQFGIQTAELRLLVPSRGERIKIGEDFYDCEDGDRYRGSTCVVDLVIVPGLQKIGDGRSDMSSKHVIVPCETYSHQAPI